MDILLKILQLVAIYYLIGVLFTMLMLAIYKKFGVGRENYEKYMELIGEPGFKFGLSLYIGLRWPALLIFFVVKVVSAFVEAINDVNKKKVK